MQDDALATHDKEIKEVFSVDDLLRVFPRHMADHTPRRVRKGIFGRSILTTEKISIHSKPKRRKLARRMCVPADKFKFTSDIAVYGHKVSLASLRGNLSGVIIESKSIATTLASLFELAWQAAKKYQNEDKKK